jgi:hypothetical protein
VLGSPWPAGVPGGLEIFFQFWIVDAAATLGFSASNSVRALTQ